MGHNMGQGKLLAFSEQQNWRIITMLNISYHHEGDYLIPDLIPPESPNIGIWGMRRRDYLRKHHDGLYTGMLLSGNLSGPKRENA